MTRSRLSICRGAARAIGPFLRPPVVALLVAALAATALFAQAQPLPNRKDSVKFAAIGDNGTGDREQYEVGEQMARLRNTFAFDLVIMLGDNMYGSQTRQDFVTKFEKPYGALLSAGVRFQASIGNHDDLSQITYPPFNMGGQRYYSFTRGNARFFALDSNSMVPDQVTWLEKSLASATEAWKIAYFHHPLYSNAARHGATVDLRLVLEPIFVRHGVDVVFQGHDHVYERIKPQQGITYFVSGAGGQLRRGNMRPTDQTAAAFDQDQSFMLVEIAGDQMFFQAISRTGKIVDAGVITLQDKRTATPAIARPHER